MWNYKIYDTVKNTCIKISKNDFQFYTDNTSKNTNSFSEYRHIVEEKTAAWMKKELFWAIFALIGIIFMGFISVIFDSEYIWFIIILLSVYVFGYIYFIISLKRTKVILEYSLSEYDTSIFALNEFVRNITINKIIQYLYNKTDNLYARTNAGATTSLNTVSISISQTPPKMIKTNIKCYSVIIKNMRLYFFPDVVILIKNRKITVLRYSDISINYTVRDIINFGTSKDIEIVGYRWKNTNNDGSPDRRFANNYQVPVCRVGQLTLGFPNRTVTQIIGSNKNAMLQAYNELIKLSCEAKTEASQDNQLNSTKLNNEKLMDVDDTKNLHNTNALNLDAMLNKELFYNELRPLYLELIEKCQAEGITFRKSTNCNDYEACTCVPAFVGSQYRIGSNNSVMFIGRAVNGWDVEWPKETDKIVFQLLHPEFNLDSITDLPEQDNYYFSKSRFFLVAKEMITKLSIKDNNWTDNFVWSNLYKVAPAINGNPNGKVQHIQRETAIKILKKEIELLQPKYIIFVTGYDYTTWSWRNNNQENTFKKEFNLQPTTTQGEYVEGYANYNGQKIIVACRPETKSVAKWVNCVIEAFKNLF